MMNELHLAARALAAKGFAVLPCLAHGKAPATSHGVRDATTDAKTIDNWWRLLPDANVGIACGAASGVFVLDIDGEDGEASLRNLEAKHGALPSTVEAITGNGRHIYFRIGEHDAVRNSAGMIAPGIDTRGDHGYVLAPPSIHPSGRRYVWSVDSAADFADAPDWLHAALIDGNGADKSALAAKWCGIAKNTISEGCRNDALTRLVGHLLRRRVDPHLARTLTLSFNATQCVPPLPDAEVVAAINSVARLEARRRGLADG